MRESDSAGAQLNRVKTPSYPINDRNSDRMNCIRRRVRAGYYGQLAVLLRVAERLAEKVRK